MEIINWERRTRNPSIYEDKYCLVFETTIQLPHHEPFKIFTFSKPIVILKHKSQENAAYEPILWDTACASISRVPFTTTPKLKWAKLKTALSVMFKETLGRGLTEQNLNFLFYKIMLNSEMALRENVLPDDYEIDRTHQLKRVARGVLVESNVASSSADNKKPSIFDWILMAMNLTKIFLPNEWEKGLIHGFVSKGDAEQMMRQQAVGTFMLRFSETKLCGLSIVCVKMKDNRVMIDHVIVSESELKDKSLQETVHKLKYLENVLCIDDTTIRKVDAFVFRRVSLQPEGYVPLVWIPSTED